MHHDHLVQIKIGHNEDHNNHNADQNDHNEDHSDHNDDLNDDHNDDHLVQIQVGHNDAVEGEGESHQARWQLKAYKSPQYLTMMTMTMTMVMMMMITLMMTMIMMINLTLVVYSIDYHHQYQISLTSPDEGLVLAPLAATVQHHSYHLSSLASLVQPFLVTLESKHQSLPILWVGDEISINNSLASFTSVPFCCLTLLPIRLIQLKKAQQIP